MIVFWSINQALLVIHSARGNSHKKGKNNIMQENKQLTIQYYRKMLLVQETWRKTSEKISLKKRKKLCKIQKYRNTMFVRMLL